MRIRDLTTPLFETGVQAKASTFSRGYGGPAFNWREYQDNAEQGQYLTYDKLYEDVQMELDMSKQWLQQKWNTTPRDLIWFEDSLSPAKYTSGLTVEQTWTEDLEEGAKYLNSLHEWLVENEAMSGGDPEPLDATQFSQIDQSTPKCIKDILWNYDWDSLDDDAWDINWGPYEWDPWDQGEWTRCREIAMNHTEDFPVTVMVNGSMIDGAHRLAVAIFERKSYHSCLVGVPSEWFRRQ